MTTTTLWEVLYDKVDQHLTDYPVARKRAGGVKNNTNYRVAIAEQNKPNVQLSGPGRVQVTSTASMSYDYVACKRFLDWLFGLGVLGKVKISSMFSHHHSSGASLWTGNWVSKFPKPIGVLPMWCRTKNKYQLPGNVLDLQL
ncbi:uncharacterized protein TNCV_2674701 [Trichonephila clavipes]|nr:uncharacterized protein TNCV_2674701 [Trichonephila clavipes]